VKYLLMIYGNQEKWDSLPQERWAEEIAKTDAYNRKYHASGEMLAAYGLGDEAQLVVRKDGAPVVSDGPYLETKEYMASFYVLDVESRERALEIAADMPWAEHDVVEVWPILHEPPADW
jgi:hypothetical protein